MLNSIKLTLAFICLGAGVFAQDTLIKKSGDFLTGIVLEQVDGYLTFRGELSEELNLISLDDLLLIKKANSPAEILYKNDTLILKNGAIIPLKILAISPDFITYFRYIGHIPSPVTTDHKDILLIKYANGTIENYSDFTLASKLSKEQLVELAQSDAKVYYKTGTGVIVGEVLLGISSVMLYPVVAGITIACVKPTKLDNPLNPNNALLKSEADYKLAYANQAKKRKVKDALISYFSGLVGIVGTIFLAVQ
jgi:hypothetical protein